MTYLASHPEIDARPRRGRPPTASGVRCVTPGCGRIINPPRIVSENDQAHAAITENVKKNGAAIDAMRAELHGIASDVAVLRDRSDRKS